MFESEQKYIEEKIAAWCRANGLPEPGIQWNWIPFAGHWGISTSFFQLAAQEARSGKKVNVALRAQEICQQVQANLELSEAFEKAEAVKGYLNLYFSPKVYLRRVIDEVLKQAEDFGRSPSKNKRVMVEFSQPNTHKAFHVGHLRNAILGNAVCNLLDASGYEVVRANYIGDIGLHVIKWLWNYISKHNGQIPPLDTTRWMGDIYSEADRLYEDQPGADAEVRALFARWDQRDPEIVKLWETTRQWSLEGFNQIYQLLGIHFDKIYFESEVEEPGKKLVKELIGRGIARDERPDGPVIIPLDEILGLKEKYRVMVVLRSDGTSLYATKDLSLAIRKFDEYHLDRSVYVVDARQSLYLQQIFKTLELMGHPWAKDCHHLAYEIVNLPGNVTMSSRDGTVVLLEDLVKEATARAMEIVSTKNPELSAENQGKIAQAVALGALKYSMLSRDNTKIVTFDWQAALDFNGQAAPYIQYAFVRANSILRRAAEAIPPSMAPDYEITPQEFELIDLISRIPREIQHAAEDFRPMLVANLAYDLAKAFNDFYNQCPVLQALPEVRDHRLRLVAATRQAIKNCLSVLGITAPEVM